MKLLLTFIALTFSLNASSQSLKDILNRKKDELLQKAKTKVENKIDNKIDQTMDKGLDGIDGAVSGKKNKRKNNTESSSTSTESTVENNENSPSNENISTSEMVISTNIKCQKGVELIEELIRDKRNVMSVSVDAATGKVYVSVDPSDSELKSTILNIISENGFSANGKASKVKSNVCK